MLQGYCLL